MIRNFSDKPEYQRRGVCLKEEEEAETRGKDRCVLREEREIERGIECVSVCGAYNSTHVYMSTYISIVTISRSYPMTHPCRPRGARARPLILYFPPINVHRT